MTAEYDRGPVFAEIHVPLERGMTAYEIGKAVNAAEHVWQAKLTNAVIHGDISWDGKNQNSPHIHDSLHKELSMI